MESRLQHYDEKEIDHLRLKMKLVEMVNMPRQILLDEIKASYCPINAEYAPENRQCWHCDLADECQQLIGGAETIHTETPMHEIMRHLFLARNYIMDKVNGQDYLSNTCRTQCCTWLRDLDELLSEMYET